MRRLVPPLLAAVALVTSCGGTAQPPRATKPPPPEVRLLQRVGTDGGWVLTDKELGWVTGTKITRRITPAGANASLISAVFFLDRTHGWAGTLATRRSMKGNDLSVFRTADAGATWKAARLRASPGAALVESVDFVDARHGFLLARDEGSTNFSAGELFRSADGGSTWAKLEAPSGGSLRFVSPSRGFIVGGADNGHLFMTNDGGRSWREQSVVLPRSYTGGFAAYAAPTFIGDRAAVLPVTVTRGSASAVVFIRRPTPGAPGTWAPRVRSRARWQREYGYPRPLPTSTLGSPARRTVPGSSRQTTAGRRGRRSFQTGHGASASSTSLRRPRGGAS